jgi:hypothetical protein
MCSIHNLNIAVGKLSELSSDSLATRDLYGGLRFICLYERCGSGVAFLGILCAVNFFGERENVSLLIL